MRARIRALSAVLAILGLVAPTGAVAQEPTAAPASPQASVPPGVTLQLSLDEAVARAMENNVDIAVQQFNPELSAQNVRAAEGILRERGIRIAAADVDGPRGRKVIYCTDDGTAWVRRL